MALRALRGKVIKDKRLKLLQKERAKQKAIVDKSTTSMTLMEKLQHQATTQVYEKSENIVTLSGKKNASKKFKPKNPNKKK